MDIVQSFQPGKHIEIWRDWCVRRGPCVLSPALVLCLSLSGCWFVSFIISLKNLANVKQTNKTTIKKQKTRQRMIYNFPKTSHRSFNWVYSPCRETLSASSWYILGSPCFKNKKSVVQVITSFTSPIIWRIMKFMLKNKRFKTPHPIFIK